MKLGDFPEFSKTMDTDCPFILLSYRLGEHALYALSYARRTDGHLDGQMDGHKDFWRDRQTTSVDSQPDTWTDRRTH